MSPSLSLSFFTPFFSLSLSLFLFLTLSISLYIYIYIYICMYTEMITTLQTAEQLLKMISSDDDTAF